MTNERRAGGPGAALEERPRRWLQVAEEIAIGGPPIAGDAPGDRPDVDALAAAGFRAVVDLRPLSERGHPPEAECEEDLVRTAGMTYVRLAYPRQDEMALACQTDDFRAAMDRIPHPVYVHSRHGGKAAALAVIWLALRHGWTGDRALELAREGGLPCQEHRLREFIRHYVDVREMARFVVAGAVVD